MRKTLIAVKLLDTAAKRAGNTATESIAQANHINSNLKKLKKSGVVNTFITTIMANSLKESLQMAVAF